MSGGWRDLHLIVVYARRCWLYSLSLGALEVQIEHDADQRGWIIWWRPRLPCASLPAIYGFAG